MTAPLTLAKPALMQWNNNPITDHNRRPLSINPERIETANRMASGTLRKYVVADKKKFSVSWENVPHSKDFTVDGFWGKNEIETFYYAVPGPFTLRITNGNGVTEDYQVMMTSYSAEISKRGFYDFWAVQVEMTEV